MNKEDRVKFLAKEVVEFFASAQDSMLQDFQAAASDGDDEDLVYAAVSLWQMNISMASFFKKVVGEGLKTAGNVAKAQEIAVRVEKMTRDHMRDIGIRSRGGLPSERAPEEPYASIQDIGELALAGKPDPSFN